MKFRESKNIYEQNLEKGFFGFWVKRHRVSFLALVLIIVLGVFSLINIPKESSPDIKFGIISITTSYIGVNPTDIDALITDKIEKEIEDIEGIKDITSSSQVGMSSITVDLYNGVDTKDVLNDIKNEVDTVMLPEDAEDPIVAEVSSKNELMFEVLLYGEQDAFSYFDLMQKAQRIKNELEGEGGIVSIDLGGTDAQGFAGDSSSEDFEIKVLLEKEKIDVLDISIRDIVSLIDSNNKNTPIGNFSIGDLHYDFRFDGELQSIEDLENVVIRGRGGSHIRLSDIAIFKKEYKSEKIQRLGVGGETGFHYVPLVFNKAPGSNIFQVSNGAKKSLESFISGNPSFEGLRILYTKDMSELILEDYSNLSGTALQTIVLVFITILIFVGLRESVIASFLIPLAFLITFSILDALGLSLNFLTNFSLVLTLGIAIDTVIVIIEGASENMRIGYKKNSAILLSVRDFRAPLIAGTLTTLVAFLPMIFLPGLMGKFLAYIPITVFTTLVAALILSLTISSALFVKFVKNSPTYHIDKRLESNFSPEQQAHLQEEREGRKPIGEGGGSLRERFLVFLGDWYYVSLKKVIRSRKQRWLLILIPVLCLLLTFVFISPRLGFTLFPPTDEGVISGYIEAKDGTREDAMEQYLDRIDDAISDIPEVDVYYSSIDGNRVDIYIDLLQENTRKEKGLRNVFEVEKQLYERLAYLESDGLNVSIETLENGPGTGKAVGIKLIASSAKKIEELKETAFAFQDHFKTIEGTKNVTTTSTLSPGQFVFRFEREKLAELGLSPVDIVNGVHLYTNGLKASSIKSEYEDNDIVVKVKEFDTSLSPDDVHNLVITTPVCEGGQCMKVRVGDVAEYVFDKAVSSINRENGKISITVESDVLPGTLPSSIQPLLVEYAEGYRYPEGISYSEGGENEENKDLIVSTFKSLFIALFLIFSILVFQFNSYGQPAVVIYSVFLALLGVNIGLFLTGNPYSMTFMIGFIALTGVVVNDAIILIDRINKNLLKGIENFDAVLQAGKSRLQPIIVTTLTTVFGILPLALQDEFWAGLGYTIVFGLFAGSSMTLFVIPALYYEMFLRKIDK